MIREEEKQKYQEQQEQENLLGSLEPYQHYRVLLLVNEEEKEQWQKWCQMAAAEKIQTLSSQYKKIMFGSSEDVKNWQTTITQIVLSNRLPSKRVLQKSGTEICKDVSEAQDGSILGWIKKAGNTETEREYILHLDADGTILAPANSSGLFERFSNVKTIDWGNCFDTKNVTDMSGMFFACKKLENLDVSHFDTQNVQNMGWMFFACKKLESLDVSHFDTKNVTDMRGMFNFCEKLENLDVSHFDTQNVTDMCEMFQGCEKLESLDVSGFDTQNVTDMSGMFFHCRSLERLDVSGFDIRNVQTKKEMFDGCASLPASAKRVGKKGVFHSLKSLLKSGSDSV